MTYIYFLTRIYKFRPRCIYTMNGENYLKMVSLFWVGIFYMACKTVNTDTSECHGIKSMEFCASKLPDSGSSCNLKTYCNVNICEINNTNCIWCKDISWNNETTKKTDIKSLVKFEKNIYYTDGNGQVQAINKSSNLKLKNVYPVLWANKLLLINRTIVYEKQGQMFIKVSLKCWMDNLIGKYYLHEKELSASPTSGFIAGNKSIEINFTSEIGNNLKIIMQPMNKICKQMSKNKNLSCMLPAFDSKKKKLQTNLTFILEYVRYFIRFEYLENPVVELINWNSSYYWGGRLLEFQVTHLSVICGTCAELFFSPNSVEKCTKKGPETIECLSPFINAKDNAKNSSDKVLILKLDNYKKNITLHYHPNPVFEKAILKDKIITITGKYLIEAAKVEEYIIVIGMENCTIKELKPNFITCEVTDRNIKGNVSVKLHKQIITVELGIYKPISEESKQIIPIGIGVFFVFVIVTLIVFKKYYKGVGRKTRKRLSIPLDDYNGRLMSLIVRGGIPFQRPSDYIKRILAIHKPPDNIRHNTQNMSENLKHSLRQFGDLLKNKYFLLPTLKALEKDKYLTQSLKYTYAYHLSLLFSSDLRYFLELCEELFCYLASQNRGPKGKKLMLSCSSITEYMILNWLGISMHSHMKENIGDLLYFFTHETKSYLEKMPIDEVTGNTYQYIFDRYRLKTNVKYDVIDIQIEMQGAIEVVQIFTCDSIVQLKKKCLAVFYRGKPASEIPDIDDICVEYNRNRIYEFRTEENNKGFTKHLTIDNWNIEENDQLRLIFAKAPQITEVDADVRYTTLGSSVARITTKSKRKFIHMQEPVDPKTERPFTKADFKKMNLPVRLEHKLIQLIFKFLDRKNNSTPHCCLYNLFKKAAKKNGTENTWMISSFFIQFCCQFIARPDILLDISQEMYTKKNLEGIKNYAVHILTRCLNEPSKDPELHESITTFWSKFSNENTNIKELMTDLQNKSDNIKRDARFSKEHSLYYIFKMMKTNYTPISTALMKDEKASRLQLGDKFLADIEQIERISISDCTD